MELSRLQLASAHLSLSLTMPQSHVPHIAAYDCPTCGQKCRSNSGFTRHTKMKHPRFRAPSESKQYKCIRHQHLSGIVFLSQG